jgi:MFS family permease
LLLLLMRILQGAAIGGEVPGAWVFVAEHVPARRIGIACGTLTAGLTVGILLGSVVATIINTSMTQQAFTMGMAYTFPAGRGVWSGGDVSAPLVAETPIFLEMQQRKALAQELPVKAVVMRHESGCDLDAADLVAVGRDCGGDFDVSGLAAKTVWFRACGNPAGEQYRHHYALFRLFDRRACR